MALEDATANHEEQTMVVSTRTVTVNAAFLQEIKCDNEQLRELLEKARSMSRPSATIRPRRFASLLAELRDQLAMHFALEEAYGYFDEPLYVAPHLSERAQSLRRQHVMLYEEISGLAEAAANVLSCNGHPHVVRKIGQRFLDFYHRLHVHEAQENELIVEAFNVDIGVGD